MNIVKLSPSYLVQVSCVISKHIGPKTIDQRIMAILTSDHCDKNRALTGAKQNGTRFRVSLLM